MLVRKITLANVKCFGPTAEVDFTHGRDDDTPHRWVVLFGDNGVGKSTLLRSFGLALTGQPALNHLVPSAEGWVRRGKPEARIRIEVTKHQENDKSPGYPRKRPIVLEWALVGGRAKTIEGRSWPSHSIVLTEGTTKERKRAAGLFKSHIATDERERGWLICGYGPHRRLTGPASELADVPPDGRAARLITLFQEKAALTSGERWLKDLQHAALSGKAGAEGQVVAVKEMINHGLMHEGVKLKDITHEGVFFDTPFSRDIPMAELSDGYRTTLAFALDLLRRVSFSFVLSDVLDTGGDHAIVTAEGVVLIDEIDSHLHPSWQRTIGEWLHTRFPNIQFIVATHSPLIPTCVRGRDNTLEGMVVRLQASTVRGTRVVEPVVDLGRLGLTADQNLTGPNFGLASTRDVLVDELQAEIARLKGRVRAKKATPKEREDLRQLEFEFERAAPVGPTHADVARWDAGSRRLREVEERLHAEESGDTTPVGAAPR